MITKKKIVIGTTDEAYFPDLGEELVKVKVDTGADSSSLHATHMKLIVVGEDVVLSVRLLGHFHCKFTDYIQKGVKSSNGQTEQRFFVNLNIMLFGQKYKGLFSLSNRGKMNFPVLLGKRFLKRNRFVVDVAKKNLSLNNNRIEI
jgi:hypothetical protein